MKHGVKLKYLPIQSHTFKKLILAFNGGDLNEIH